MTELKTLKDLDMYGVDADGCLETSTIGHLIKEDELRQEAIKWAKQMYEDGKFQNLEGKDKEAKYVYQQERLAIYRWIKHFFNITDDDLKRWLNARNQ